MLTKAFFILAVAVASVNAGPTPNGLIVLRNETTASGGHLLFYGSAPGPAIRVSTRQQCGGNAIACSGDHVPSSSACSSLVSEIESTGSEGVAESPRSICLSVDNSECCVSWADAVPGLVRSDLVDAASETLSTCVDNNQSGLARGVNLNGICTTQCLSNRADGCSD